MANESADHDAIVRAILAHPNFSESDKTDLINHLIEEPKTAAPRLLALGLLKPATPAPAPAPVQQFTQHTQQYSQPSQYPRPNATAAPTPIGVNQLSAFEPITYPPSAPPLPAAVSATATAVFASEAVAYPRLSEGEERKVLGLSNELHAAIDKRNAQSLAKLFHPTGSFTLYQTLTGPEAIAQQSAGLIEQYKYSKMPSLMHIGTINAVLRAGPLPTSAAVAGSGGAAVFAGEEKSANRTGGGGAVNGRRANVESRFLAIDLTTATATWWGTALLEAVKVGDQWLVTVFRLDFDGDVDPMGTALAFLRPNGTETPGLLYLPTPHAPLQAGASKLASTPKATNAAERRHTTAAVATTGSTAALRPAKLRGDWKYSAVKVTETMGLRQSLAVVTYAGGATEMGQVIFQTRLPPPPEGFASERQRALLAAHVFNALTEQSKCGDPVAAVAAVRHLKLHGNAQGVGKLMRDLKWEFHFTVSSQSLRERSGGADDGLHNLFAHGKLFADGTDNANRTPLIGVWSTGGVEWPSAADSDAAVERVGFERLKWADQHIHPTDGGVIHVGGAMAAFSVNKSVAHMLAVAIDLHSLTAELSLIVIVNSDVHASVEALAAAGEANPSQFAAKLCELPAFATNAPLCALLTNLPALPLPLPLH